MKTEVIKQGWVKLTAPNGVADKRNGQVYPVVITRESNAGYFAEV